jgi:uncharacterized protein YdbL (DUF1318 family)
MTQTFPFTRFRITAAATALVAALALAPAAQAIEDPVLNAAINAGDVGETVDGFLRVVEGSTVSQAVRDRLNQNEAGRRAVYQESARRNGVPLETFARSTACTLIPKNTPVGGLYRNADGAWVRNTGRPALPDYCPAAP